MVPPHRETRLQVRNVLAMRETPYGCNAVATRYLIYSRVPSTRSETCPALSQSMEDFSLQPASSGMRWDSENTAPATSTAMLGASVSPSIVSTEARKVRLSDRELLHCVQSVSVPDEPVDLRGISSRHGWKHVRVGVSGDMKMYFKAQAQRCQVLVGGGIRAQVSELLSLLRASTESESNALMQALFGSHFIYSSLVHAAAFSERGSLESVISRGSVTAAGSTGQQLVVRTASFARSRVVCPFTCRSSTPMKNDQICYVELLTPTQEGFRILYCSIDQTDVTTGKAPLDNAVTLHPLTGWLTVEPMRSDPDKLRFTFQAAFDGTEADVCDLQVAQTRLRLIGKGVCRIEKVLRRRQRKRYQLYVTPGWLWLAILKPFRALGVLREESTRRNWHCIACTRSFFPTLSKRWRRCDLCSYRICANSPCCSHERVAIYNRYVVSLSVCARCRECIDERDSDHRGSVHRVGGLPGDPRYNGLSLRADPISDLDPEEDPSILSYDRVRMAEALKSARRQRGRPQMKRRTQSDPSL